MMMARREKTRKHHLCRLARWVSRLRRVPVVVGSEVVEGMGVALGEQFAIGLLVALASGSNGISSMTGMTGSSVSSRRGGVGGGLSCSALLASCLLALPLGRLLMLSFFLAGYWLLFSGHVYGASRGKVGPGILGARLDVSTYLHESFSCQAPVQPVIVRRVEGQVNIVVRPQCALHLML